jgi:peptide/nickel transport system substrate-binding protein
MGRNLVVGAAVAALLAGCGEGERAADSAAVPDSLRYGGTVVVAALNEINSMNHFASTDETSQDFQGFVLFTPLIRYDENLAPTPYLAESWDTVTTRSGGLVLTFSLRDDVKWHDGVPTSAYDVKFTFDRIKAPRTSYRYASLLQLYDSAVVQDSFTVALYLRRYPGYMDPWRRISPMPEHLLGDVAPAQLGHHPFGTESPVGNGPFRFVEHRTGDRWVFEANQDFAESLGGRPYLDRLVYRYIPESTTRLAEFLAGEVDLYLVVAPDRVAEIEARPETRVITYENRNYAFVVWNGRRTFFQDPAVRRALTLAIDRQRIVDVARQGLGRVAKGPVPPFHWAHHAELEPLKYSPDSARMLLELAGWVDEDGDGVRENDVNKASFELVTNVGSPTREQILTLVQADLAQVGVDVSVRLQEAQSLGADIMDPERRFDASVLGWSAEFNLDDRILFACSQLDGQFQWASYCNPRVDEILDRVAITEDRSRALPLWHEYQEILQWEQPYTFLYYDVRANAVRERVRGVEMDIRGDFISVKDWWIAPADRR